MPLASRWPYPAIALLLFALTACGNPAPATPSSKPTASAPASLSENGHYSIGLLASLSGPYAARGIAARDAVQLAAKEVNARGGIDHHPVDVLVEDDQGDASQAVVALKDIVNHNALALIGPETNVTAVAVLPLEDQAKLPAMSLAGDQSQTRPVHKFVFAAAPPPSLLATNLLSYLQKSNIHAIAVLREMSAYGNAGIDQLRQQGGTFGVQVISDETYQLTDSDMTRQLTNIKNNPAVKAMLIWASPGTAAAIATKQFQQLGMAVPLLLTADQADLGYVQVAGSAANGAVLEANKLRLLKYLLPADPSYQPVMHFTTAYKQATGKDADSFAGLGYDAFNILAQAASRAGAAPDRLVAELEKTTFNGVAGPYAFTSGSHAGMQASALAMVTVRDGAFVPIKPNCDGCAVTTVTKE